MIFVTVGTQLPFDRLVKGVDHWASLHPDVDVFVQAGKGGWQPRHCRFSAFTDAEQWERLFQDADLVVSHAGMGTILKGLDYGKPLVIMPRLAARGEHRNDHQVATARRFSGFANIRVVNDEGELAAALDDRPTGTTTAVGPSRKLEALVAEIRRFVNE